jgi:hypothetical protein
MDFLPILENLFASQASSGKAVLRAFPRVLYFFIRPPPGEDEIGGGEGRGGKGKGGRKKGRRGRERGREGERKEERQGGREGGSQKRGRAREGEGEGEYQNIPPASSTCLVDILYQSSGQLFIKCNSENFRKKFRTSSADFHERLLFEEIFDIWYFSLKYCRLFSRFFWK